MKTMDPSSGETHQSHKPTLCHVTLLPISDDLQAPEPICIWSWHPACTYDFIFILQVSRGTVIVITNL